MSKHDAGVKAAAILKAQAGARYAAVSHLTDAEAAIALGITQGSVRSYRRTHAEVDFRAEKGPSAVSAIDDAQNTQRPYSGPPRRSVTLTQIAAITGYTTTARVSVAREPWGEP